MFTKRHLADGMEDFQMKPFFVLNCLHVRAVTDSGLSFSPGDAVMAALAAECGPQRAPRLRGGLVH